MKWIPDRQEAFLSDVQGRDHVSLAEMALDKDCKFLALRVTTHAALGAYLSHFGAFIPTMAGSGMLAGLYQTPAIYVNVKGVMTNTVPTDAYRGAGRPGSRLSAGALRRPYRPRDRPGHRRRSASATS